MVDWFVRGKDGSDLNSGGTNSPAPELEIDDLQVDGTRATSLTSSFTRATARSINIQDDGDSIRRFDVVDDHTIALAMPLASGPGRFRARVGGARATINRAANSDSRNNPALRESDTVLVQGGFYYEQVDLDLPCSIRAFDGQVHLDASGQGAGSSPLTMVAGAFVEGFTISNSVDSGIWGRPQVPLDPARLTGDRNRRGPRQDEATFPGTRGASCGGKMLETLGKLLDALRGVDPSSEPSSSVYQSQQNQVGHSLQNVVVNASGGDGISLPQVQRVAHGYPASIVRVAFATGVLLGGVLVALAWALSRSPG